MVIVRIAESCEQSEERSLPCSLLTDVREAHDVVLPRFSTIDEQSCYIIMHVLGPTTNQIKTWIFTEICDFNEIQLYVTCFPWVVSS